MDELSFGRADSRLNQRRSDEYALLPTQSPLPMQAQPLRSARRPDAVRDRLTWPRAILLAMTCCATAVFAYELYQVLSIVRLTVLQGVFLVLCTLCFAWIALGTSSALIGFFAAILLRTRNAEAPAHVPLPEQRTALLFPVYHEDPARIAATMEAIANELIALGTEKDFVFFMLSDSRAAALRARELRAVRLLRRQLRERVHIYYRARADNIGKKAGNIADWVQRFGASYAHFVILDADSVMSGALLTRLSSLMARRTQIGLVQTVPRLVGADTLFARLQQYAVAVYGPVIAHGFAAWHSESGNYWGHNAIIRTRAFAEAAGLPYLSGVPPLGGHIQSHDFVEAAFLRRAGWEVWMMPDLRGSYEGCPPTLIDSAVRDRRWAQGNLQHMRIVGASDLPWISRMHLAMGTYGYFASLFWALSLVVGVVLSWQTAYTLPVYFTEQKTLFPIWPVIDPIKALYLFLGTIAIVLLPKVLGVLLAFMNADVAPRRVGWFLLGAAVETVFSILIAPILMLTQSSAVLEILCGKDAGWSAQRRGAEASLSAELLRFHRTHMLIGAVLTVLCILISFYVLAWMAPIILGLLLSMFISALVSRRPPAWVQNALATRETLSQPAIVAAATKSYSVWANRLQKDPTGSARQEQSSP